MGRQSLECWDWVGLEGCQLGLSSVGDGSSVKGSLSAAAAAPTSALSWPTEGASRLNAAATGLCSTWRKAKHQGASTIGGKYASHKAPVGRAKLHPEGFGKWPVQADATAVKVVLSHTKFIQQFEGAMQAATAATLFIWFRLMNPACSTLACRGSLPRCLPRLHY